MKKLEKIVTIIIILTFVSTLVCITKVQASEENMKTFFDSEIPGMRIQVNATAETHPTKNITVTLSLEGLTVVDVKHLNLSIFGFSHGKDKTLMANITDNNFSLDDTSIKEYNYTFQVPNEVWDVTYGEISLTYFAKYFTDIGDFNLRFSQLTFGFTMTHVANVYLEDIKELLESYKQLNQTFRECFQMNFSAEDLTSLNQTYWELQESYTSFQGSLGELENTRMAVIILAVTTVFFVATTIFMVMRKPKQYW